MMRVLLSSVGRRNYLVQWFREAAALVGIEAEIWGSDGDPHAPGLAVADQRLILPPIASQGYVEELVSTCIDQEISLVLSLHDYDIAMISDAALDRLLEAGITVAVPPKATLDVVSDKLSTIETLINAGLNAPLTVLGADTVSIPTDRERVVKHRYGSGSSGVFIVDPQYLVPAVTLSSITAPRMNGEISKDPDLSLVVIQERIRGVEYGLDVICDFDGKYQGVLARKKLRMRAGETDRAVTVDPAPFERLARVLSSTLQLSGNTDVDVIVTPDGEQYIIDINPRFGGGYPFVHVAGANVPACYLAWTLGKDIDPAWLKAEIGVVSSKYQAIQRSVI